MIRIPIRVGDSRYDALVGSGLLDSLGHHAVDVARGRRCAVIADTNTAALFSETLLRSLHTADFTAFLITVPAGESSKSLQQVGVVCDEMAAGGLDRSSFLVALGGGVVGDLAGFAAAIYHRGVPHIQVPTTLLAQVDSSIGGKTAINTIGGKNLLGAIHQPALVVADLDTLASLPDREFRQGFAEIIKHAIVADPAMFDLLKAAQATSLQSRQNTSWKVALQDLVHRNMKIKASIVAQDERDLSGPRAILNFGHTIGHAIERAGGYSQFLH
ncbi:MAG: 3-dehydroquinate synthase, partial [Chthoniobacterales bacterium]